MATDNSFGGQPHPFKNSVFNNGLFGVLRAGRIKNANLIRPDSQPSLTCGKKTLIKFQQLYCEPV